MTRQTTFKLTIFGLIYTAAQAHAESGGAPIRLAVKMLSGLVTTLLGKRRARAALPIKTPGDHEDTSPVPDRARPAV